VKYNRFTKKMFSICTNEWYNSVIGEIILAMRTSSDIDSAELYDKLLYFHYGKNLYFTCQNLTLTIIDKLILWKLLNMMKAFLNMSF